MKKLTVAKLLVICLPTALLALPAAAGETCDSERGVKLFSKCAVCHANNETSRGGVGPNLHGVIDRDIASEPDFPYSLAMEEREGVWTIEALDRFIKSPMQDLPGTMMAFAGFKKEQDRRDVICHLKQ